MTELDVTKITLRPDEPAVFLVRLPEHVSTQALGARVTEIWNHLWKSAGAERIPPLLVVPDGVEVSALSGADLERAGLMKIPADSPKR